MISGADNESLDLQQNTPGCKIGFFKEKKNLQNGTENFNYFLKLILKWGRDDLCIINQKKALYEF